MSRPISRDMGESSRALGIFQARKKVSGVFRRQKEDHVHQERVVWSSGRVRRRMVGTRKRNTPKMRSTNNIRPSNTEPSRVDRCLFFSTIYNPIFGMNDGMMMTTRNDLASSSISFSVLRSARLKASRFLGSGKFECLNDDENKLAGIDNIGSLNHLVEFLNRDLNAASSDMSDLCACVEGPSLSGKSMCCELAFSATKSSVERWESLSHGSRKHTSAPSAGVDSYFRKYTDNDAPVSSSCPGTLASTGRKGGSERPRVIFLDNMHTLIKEDKGCFQNLLRCVASARDKIKSSSKMIRVKKMVVSFDKTKLDSRILSHLISSTQYTHLHMSYPPKQDVVSYLTARLDLPPEMIASSLKNDTECLRTVVRRLVSLLDTKIKGENDEILVSVADIKYEDNENPRDGALDEGDHDFRNSTRSINRNFEIGSLAKPNPHPSCATVCHDEYKNKDKILSFNTASKNSLHTISSAMSAVCLFDAYYEKNRALQLDFADTLFESTRTYVDRITT